MTISSRRRRLSLILSLVLLLTSTVVGFTEKDEEFEEEDKELTAKLWELVDKLDQEAHATKNKPSKPFSERTKNGSIGFFSPNAKCKAEDGEDKVCSSDSSDDDEECVDLWNTCEKAARMGDCLYEDDSEACPRSCLICRLPENETFPIGKPQIYSENFIEGVLEDLEELEEESEGMDTSMLKLDLPYKTNETLIEALAKQIIGTHKYMSEVVMEDPEYERVRRSCQNYWGHCEIYAAIGYCDNNFMGGEDFLDMRTKCAPACRTCEDLAILQPCHHNFDHNYIQEGDLEKMFRRMVGELGDVDKKDLPYKPTIHARPGGVPKKDYVDGETGKISKTKDPVDGSWLITLEDFLTPEECDRFIELGALEGYSRSGLQMGEDKKKHRTSTNAWCSEKHCENDPIAQRVVERISNTTGLPPEYSEPLQLLKYTPGQYYKMHHDVDLPHEKYWPQGPRVLTFFLYLNEVEEGGATRMVDISHDDEPAGPGEYQDECLAEANTTEAKAECALIEMDIKPKRGMALVWPNLLDSDHNQKNPGTWHEARPVVKGVKYGANAWFRLRRFDRECNTVAYEAWLDSYNMTYDSALGGGNKEEGVISMETLEDGATSNTKVETKKESKNLEGEDDDGVVKTTTITTTTTTISTTPTTITTTTTQVITTTTVTKRNDNKKDDDEEEREEGEDNESGQPEDSEDESEDED